MCRFRGAGLGKRPRCSRVPTLDQRCERQESRARTQIPQGKQGRSLQLRDKVRELPLRREQTSSDTGLPANERRLRTTAPSPSSGEYLPRWLCESSIDGCSLPMSQQRVSRKFRRRCGGCNSLPIARATRFVRRAVWRILPLQSGGQ